MELIQNNSVSIYNKKKSKQNSKGLYIKSDFFQHQRPVIVNIFDYGMIIKNPDIDYNGVTYSPQRHRENTYVIEIYSEMLPIGNFLIDQEDSNEDELIIYF